LRYLRRGWHKGHDDGAASLPKRLNVSALFVLTAGYNATNVPAEIRSLPIVQKPFQQRELERALRQACTLQSCMLWSSCCTPAIGRTIQSAIAFSRGSGQSVGWSFP
jgi:hypothetical protein